MTKAYVILIDGTKIEISSRAINTLMFDYRCSECKLLEVNEEGTNRTLFIPKNSILMFETFEREE